LNINVLATKRKSNQMSTQHKIVIFKETDRTISSTILLINRDHHPK
jgi:hypothetical protein